MKITWTRIIIAILAVMVVNAAVSMGMDAWMGTGPRQSSTLIGGALGGIVAVLILFQPVFARKKPGDQADVPARDHENKS